MQDFKRGGPDEVRGSDKVRPSGLPYLASTRDMARLGYLMLRKGNWAASDHAARMDREITAPVTRLPDMNPPFMREGRVGYGYLWWVFDARGAGSVRGAFTGWAPEASNHRPAEARPRRRPQDEPGQDAEQVRLRAAVFELLDKLVAARVAR